MKKTKLFAWIRGGKKFWIIINWTTGCGTAVVCVHRTADGKDDIFLNMLEIIIQTLIVNNKILILDGDWNIIFLHKSWNKREFNNFILCYNVKHTANIPIRITKYTLTMLDVMTINEKFQGSLSS